MTNIKDLLPHRSDLSTFIIHLTKGDSASDSLKSIITNKTICAKSSFGHKKDEFLSNEKINSVCFTETPLEYLYMFTEAIEGRHVNYQPYGIALTKKIARECGVNPVWYVDMSMGRHEWLSKPLDKLFELSKTNDEIKECLKKLFPLFDHMVLGKNTKRKEFWWEREWRYVGNFNLPDNFIGLCPDNEIDDFETFVKERGWKNLHFIDPRWGLEKIIARLAGIINEHIDLY